MSDVRDKWRRADAAAHYERARWSTERKRARDPSLVAALLARHLPAHGPALLLDAPCGAGRLRPALARHGRYVGLDVSLAMLGAARAARAAEPCEGDAQLRDGDARTRDRAPLADGEDELLLGDLTRLPFQDDRFDAVVCCRLLHHLAEPAALARVVSELVRVSRGCVIASFWDAGSLPAWRRRVFGARRPARRHARPRSELAAAFGEAGAEVIGFRHTLRFLSRQAFVVARKLPRA